MYRGRKRIVGTLATVHVIVGMHGLLRVHLSTRHFNRAVGNDFVGIHIGLGARTSLKHDQRKMIIKFSRDHLICSAHDEIDFLLWQFTQFPIGQRRRGNASYANKTLVK